MDTNNENTYFVSVKKKLKKNSRLFSNREKIFYLLNKNKGYITTKEISHNRIARDYLRWLVDYGEIRNKFAVIDTLVDRFTFLCDEKEVTHLVTDKRDLPFVIEDSTIATNSQKIYLYGFEL